MTDLYNAAANEFPVMREEARRRRSRVAEREAGVQTLFGEEADLEGEPVGPKDKLYERSPPWLPYGTAETP